jgi:NAD(P)-dependent dehydrogenase (short-subunit alcohol dehydrogenase family)
MQAQQKPLPTIGVQDLAPLNPTGLFLITEDELSVAAYVSDALQQRGAKTAIITTSSLRSPEQLASLVDQYRQMHGAVTGIVHLAPLASIPIPDTLAQWRHYTQIQSKSLFQLLQLCSTDLQQAGQQQQGWVVAASLLGGHFGRDGYSGSGLATGGSSSGLLKTLITEWSGVHAKAIDFDSSLSPADIAQHIINELLLPGGRVEIGYPQGNRTIFQTVSAPLQGRGGEGERSSQPLIPSADWVVLVTGGARGITSEIASEIVVPGMTLVVVGLSPEPSEESPTTTGITEIGELRRVLLEQAKSQGLSITPMQIERQLRKLLRDRAIRRNLERFRQTGAKFEYLPVDVRNSEEFGSLIEGIYSRYGRLDAVIHGAGIIEDKLITDKTLASFDRVFDTKVDSTFILSHYLRPDSLKALILFGSVAGCYGNRGQSDYAAANEVMNRLACQIDALWANTRVVAINWGPWDTTGMASEDVKRQFRERGIIPIPLAAGRQFFIDELCYGLKGESNVVAGDGPWALATLKVTTPNGQVNNNKLEYPASEREGFVFLSSQPQLQPNSTVTLEHTFSLASDPYLCDHCLDGKPVLPAAGALEWMAEFVQSAWPEWTVAEVRDLKVMRGLVLDTEVGRNVLFNARASSHADSDSLQVAVEILEADRKIPFYRASIILRPQLEESPTIPLIPLNSGTSLDATKAYRDYLFHGDRFQLVTSIARLNEQGIDAWVMPSQPAAWVNDLRSPSTPNWLFDPGLIDTAPQLAIIWDRVQRGSTALPSRLGAVVRYGQAPLTGQMQLALRVKSASEYTLVYDAVFLDETGKVRLHLQDIESTSNAALNRLANRL